MVRASATTIVTCERLVRSEELRSGEYAATLPYYCIDAVVLQPFGAYPTSTYGLYSYDEAELRRYQRHALEDSVAFQSYLEEHVHGCASFDAYLDRDDRRSVLKQLEHTMREDIFLGAHIEGLSQQDRTR
jgi:glutaconate CoA-transferase, subunit A